MTDKISVIGLGKLGAPLVAVLASSGFKVSGYDLDEHLVNELNAGRSPIQEPGLKNLLAQYKDNITGSSNISELLENAVAIFIIVPTPSGPDDRFSNQYVLDAVTKIGSALKKNKSRKFHVVNIVSTVMPGSTSGIIKETLEKSSGLKVGETIGLTYNPEFIALGSVIKNMHFPDVTLIGCDDNRSGKIILNIYSKVVKKEVSEALLSTVDAEITKIAINTFVTTKISFANTISAICRKHPGANANMVCNAVGQDTRVGNKYFTPGAPFGGPCFPRDGRAFSSLLEGSPMEKLAIATCNVNAAWSEQLVEEIIACAGSDPILVAGLSYKPGTQVVEESFGCFLIDYLQSKGLKYKIYNSEENVVMDGRHSWAVLDEGSLEQFSGLVVLCLPDENLISQLAKNLEPNNVSIVDIWGSCKLLESEKFNFRLLG